MRHKNTDRLGRFSSYRKATIKSLVISVLINQSIVTTKAKAKSARGLLERVITLGKKNTLFARRRAFSFICDHVLVKKLFDEIAPLFANRVGGYTRIIPYRNQRGDNAQLVVLELTETYKKAKVEKKPKEEKKAKPPEAEKEEPKVVKREPEPQAKVEIKEKPEKPVRPEKPEPVKEKPIRPEIKEKKEEAPKPEEAPLKTEAEKKPEEKKPKKMFGGFKGLFKKKDHK